MALIQEQSYVSHGDESLKFSSLIQSTQMFHVSSSIQFLSPALSGAGVFPSHVGAKAELHPWTSWPVIAGTAEQH